MFLFYKAESGLEEMRCVAQVAGGTGALPTLSGRRGHMCDVFGPRWKPPQSFDSRLSTWGAGQGVGG